MKRRAGGKLRDCGNLIFKTAAWALVLLAPGGLAPAALAQPQTNDAIEALALDDVQVPPPPPPPLSPSIMGLVGVPVGQTRADSRWQRASSAGGSDFRRFTGPVARRGRMQQAAFVNAYVNRNFVYKEDSQLWGRPDHWATAEETLARRAGDCEDLAILKLHLLRSLGFDPRDLYLVVGQTPTRAWHALLLVRLGDQFFALDDRFARLLPGSAVKNFRPTIAHGSGMSWVYGKPRSAGAR